MRAISVFPESCLDGGEDVPTFRVAGGAVSDKNHPQCLCWAIAHWEFSPLGIKLPLTVALAGPHQCLLQEVPTLSNLPISVLSTSSVTTSASPLESPKFSAVFAAPNWRMMGYRVFLLAHKLRSLRYS